MHWSALIQEAFQTYQITVLLDSAGSTQDSSTEMAKIRPYFHCSGPDSTEPHWNDYRGSGLVGDVNTLRTVSLFHNLL